MRQLIALAAVCAVPWVTAAADPQVTSDASGARVVLPAPTPPALPKDFVEEDAGLSIGWVPIGPFGGNVFDVHVSPLDPNVVLAGLGTIYRSTDGGQHWTAMPTPGIQVNHIEFTPTGICYVATADSIWRSLDNGLTFTRIEIGLGPNDTTHCIAFEPGNPDHLWVGVDDHLGFQTNNVVFSPDAGATWFNATPPLPSPMACRGLAIDPNDPNRIYAGFGGAFGGGALWVSLNGGGNWDDRSAGLPGTPVNDVVHDGTRVLVTGGQLFGSQNFGLFASIDDGQNWTELDNAWPILACSDLELDPNNINIIVAASLGAGVYRSIDGGQTWSVSIGGTGGVSLFSVRFAPGDSNWIQLGASSLAVLQSHDAGAHFLPTANGIGQLSLFSVAANPNDGREIAVAFEGDNNGGVYTSVDGGMTWTVEPLPGTRFNFVRFAPDGTLYAISNGPTTIGLEGLYRRNIDGTWTPIGPDVGPLFETDLDWVAFSLSDPNLLVASGGDFGVAGFERTIWRTIDGGAHWDKVYEPAGSNGHVRNVQRVQDGADLVLVAAFDDRSGGNLGGALRSTDGGSTWGGAEHGLNPLFTGAALAAWPGDVNTFFLANSYNPTGGPPGGGLQFTPSAGQGWVSTGFLDPVNDVLCDPLDDQVVYLMNSSQLVLRSADRGASAQPFNAGLGGAGQLRQMAYAGGAVPRLLLASSSGTYARDLAPRLGDLNCDGFVNNFDITPFVLALTDPAGYAAQFPNCDLANADINQDGLVNNFDITPFVHLLSGE